jgi:hypothetical protein
VLSTAELSVDVQDEGRHHAEKDPERHGAECHDDGIDDASHDGFRAEMIGDAVQPISPFQKAPTSSNNGRMQATAMFDTAEV